MPIFAGLFQSLFATLAGFFAASVTKKAALGLAALTTFGILTTAFMIAISVSITAALAVTGPPAWFVTGLWLILPSNFVECVSLLIGAWTAKAIYAWNVENLRLLAYVT